VRRGECWRYQLRAIPVGPMVIIVDKAIYNTFGLTL
jgi:hypothetical protein